MIEVATFEEIDDERTCLDPYVLKAIQNNSSESFADLGRQIAILEETSIHFQGEVTQGILCPSWVVDACQNFSEDDPPTVQAFREMDAWRKYTDAFIYLAKACYAHRVSCQMKGRE